MLQFGVPAADAGLGKRCLRVEAHLGKDTGGGLTKWFEPADTVFIRFYTKFDPECDYVHHFVTLRANKGLRGGDKWITGTWTKNPVNVVWFDNVVIARRYIGPVARP